MPHEFKGSPAKRLHLGCGRDIKEGWVNVDNVSAAGVNIVCDLDKQPLPVGDNTYDELLASHLLEHLHNPLFFMQEMHRVAKAGALLTIKVPYGSSDNAFEDPTHVRNYFVGSFNYFAQQTYKRADYGYRGDWDTRLIRLFVDGHRYAGKPKAVVLAEVTLLRNTVLEMHAFLYAIKPVRDVDAKFDGPLIEVIATGHGKPDEVLV